MTGPPVWRAVDMADRSTWTWTLSDSECDHLLEETEPFADDDLDDVRPLSRTDVPLPHLANRLDALRSTLVSGKGFEVVAGLPVDSIPVGHAAAAFMAIGAHIGSARRQNAAGDLLGHVRDSGADAADPNVRIYQTTERQTFHTDSADGVGLLCLQDAETGGESLLVSAAAIYNEMLAIDTELAHALFAPVATDRRGEVGPGQSPFFTIPVLSWFDESLTVIYQRQYIDSAQRFDDAPKLSARHTAALDLFDDLANRTDLHIRMRLEPGDMQFVHNHSLLHDRTSFVDRAEQPRHLLRLWLAIPGDRELPPAFAERYGSTTVGDRGGVQ